ncbi:hypothetical protein TWF173_005891 [Orbilia oligospora]|nr:hypothetical protein TWF173_005891 [Orbilia oligospora]
MPQESSNYMIHRASLKRNGEVLRKVLLYIQIIKTFRSRGIEGDIYSRGGIVPPPSYELFKPIIDAFPYSEASLVHTRKHIGLAIPMGFKPQVPLNVMTVNVLMPTEQSKLRTLDRNSLDSYGPTYLLETSILTASFPSNEKNLSIGIHTAAVQVHFSLSSTYIQSS